MSLLMDALRRAEEARRTHAKDDDSRASQRAAESGPELSLAPANAPEPDADAPEPAPAAGAQAPPADAPREERAVPAAGRRPAEGAAGATLTLSPMEPDARLEEAPGPAASSARTWAGEDLRAPAHAHLDVTRAAAARPPRQMGRAMTGARPGGRRRRIPLVSTALVAAVIVAGAAGYRYWRAVSVGPSVMVQGSPTTHAVGSPQSPADLRPTGARAGQRTHSASPAVPAQERPASEPGRPLAGSAPASPAPARNEPDTAAAQRAPSFGSFGPQSPGTRSTAPRAAEGVRAPGAPAGGAATAASREPNGPAVTAGVTGGTGSEIRITRAPRTHPVRALLARAYEAYRDGNDVLAGARYRHVLEHEAGNRDALLGLAAVAVRRGDLEEAARRYLDLLRRNPRDSVAQAGLMGLQTGADPAASESRLKLLLEEEPGAAHLHFSLGNLYAEQGRWAEAERAYFEAYRADRENPDYALNLAVSLDHMQQRAAALSYYRRALELASFGRGGFEAQAVRERIQALSESAEGS